MSKIKEVINELSEGEPWNAEWALESLLQEGELVTKAHYLESSIKYIEAILTMVDLDTIGKKALEIVKKDLELVIKSARVRKQTDHKQTTK